MTEVAERAAPPHVVDRKDFRETLSRFATGIVAVTALQEDDFSPVGLAINSFVSVSLEPPLVLFCVAHSSTSWPQVRSAKTLCINILGEDQLHVSDRFAARGVDKFRDVSWTLTPNGAPRIDASVGWLECEIESEQTAGDHDVVIARVHRLGKSDDGLPLVFFRSMYGRYSTL